MKLKERFIDLSDIKDEELDKTATFTDLMSRSERKRRKKEKEKTDEVDTINSDIKENNKDLEINSISEIESNENLLEFTNKYEDLDNNIKTLDENDTKERKNIFKREIEYNIEEDDILETNKLFNTGLIITNGLFILISTGMFLYSIIFTDTLNKEKLLIIDSIILSSMYFIFGLSIITHKSFSKILSIFNYLIFIAFISYNVLITLNIIK